MSGHPPEIESLCCPTCGARQAPSAECRRCRCDLALLLAVHGQARMVHRCCLRHFRAGAHPQAFRCALLRHQLAPDETSRRLLAVACLCLERYAEAIRWAESM